MPIKNNYIYAVLLLNIPDITQTLTYDSYTKLYSYITQIKQV